MKSSCLLLCAALGAPLVVSAQTAKVQATDPNAPAPSLQYHSVFADYVPAVEPKSTPDQNWLRANRVVAGDTAAAADASAARPANQAAASKTSSPHHQHQQKGRQDGKAS